MSINTKTKYIVGGNSTGKTKRLIEFAAANKSIVICKNPNGMRAKAQAYGYYDLTCISYEEGLVNALSHDSESSFDNYVIDEVADFLDYMFGFGQCVGFTQTQE